LIAYFGRRTRRKRVFVWVPNKNTEMFWVCVSRHRKSGNALTDIQFLHGLNVRSVRGVRGGGGEFSFTAKAMNVERMRAFIQRKHRIGGLLWRAQIHSKRKEQGLGAHSCDTRAVGEGGEVEKGKKREEETYSKQSTERGGRCA
jgi:hypothetical protein